jgi:hypothetical protein
MAERVQAGLFRRAIRRQNARRDLRRMPSVKHDIAVTPHMAAARNKNDVGLSRTSQPQFPQGIRHDRGQRDRPLAGFRLWRPDRIISISPLPDVKLAFFEIDVGPAQTAQLGGPEPGKDRR